MMDYIIMGLGIAVGFYLLPVVLGACLVAAGVVVSIIANIFRR